MKKIILIIGLFFLAGCGSNTAEVKQPTDQKNEAPSMVTESGLENTVEKIILDEEKKNIKPDFETEIMSIGNFKTNLKISPHSNSTFDEIYFLKMLAGSLSLTKNEKAMIVQAIPQLSQYQIDELIKILEEEHRKFAELDDSYQDEIKKLQKRQEEDWDDLEVKASQQDKKQEVTVDLEALADELSREMQNP